MPNDFWLPCNVWCDCVDGQCVPSTPMFNAELLRTRDGRPVKARLADPAFEVVLRRPILLAQDSLSDAKLARVPVTFRNVDFGIDWLFRQVWNLTNLTIGDLEHTTGLAPLKRDEMQAMMNSR